MKKIVFSNEFSKDYKQALKKYSPREKNKFHIEFKKRIESISVFPKMGKSLLLKDIITPYRYFLIFQFAVFYHEKSDCIIVLRMFHQKTDYINKFISNKKSRS